MGFMPDEDAERLREYLRAFLDKESPQSRVRESMESELGYDPALWSRAAQELGLQGIGIAEQFGGSGAGLRELGVVFEELGRALVCAPFLSTVALAATALSRLPEVDGVADQLAAIAAGEAIATLVWAGARPEQSGLQARGGRITGVAETVVDGHLADVLLVAARTEDGAVALFDVEPAAAGVVRTALAPMDLTRRLARVHFDDAPGRLLAADAAAGLSATMDTATLLLAAEQLGGAQHVLRSSVEYARTRIQFGRQIGSFQAVKHRCADMLVEIESARSAVYHALDAAQADPSTLALEAALAGSLAGDAYLHAAAANLQLHGGIGFTWEHDAHLYLKRAKSSSLIFMSPAAHRRRLAERLDLTGVAG